MVTKNEDVVPKRDSKGRCPLYVACSNKNIDAIKTLISQGCDVNLSVKGGEETGRTPLHAAVVTGSDVMVRLLIEKGALCDVQDRVGVTPLHLAVMTQNSACVDEILYNCKKCSNMATSGGHSPLHMCMYLDQRPSKKRIDIATSLSTKSHLSLVHPAGYLPVHWAAYWNLTKLLNHILDAYQCVNACDVMERTPLHYCFSNPNLIPVDTAMLLMLRGGDFFRKDSEGKIPLDNLLSNTHAHDDDVRLYIRQVVGSRADEGKSLLHYVVLNERSDLLKYVCKCEVDINIKDSGGFSALHFATITDQIIALNILLHQGADRNIQNNLRQTPLHYSVVLDRETSTNLLLRHGANFNIKDKYGMTPLHKAAGWGPLSIVRLLIQKGAIICVPDNDGHHPLHISAAENKVENADYLLLHGANVNEMDKQGRTPLHQAAKTGKADMIKLLLIYGAQVDSVDKVKQTALHLACYYGKTNAVDTLLNRDSDTSLEDIEGHTAEDLAVANGKHEVLMLFRDKRAAEDKYNLEKRKGSHQNKVIHWKSDNPKVSILEDAESKCYEKQNPGRLYHCCNIL